MKDSSAGVLTRIMLYAYNTYYCFNYLKQENELLVSTYSILFPTQKNVIKLRILGTKCSFTKKEVVDTAHGCATVLSENLRR